MMRHPRTFSELLLEFLLKRQMTLTEIVGIVDLPDSEITLLENGRREFKAGHLVLIAKFLNLPLETLIASVIRHVEDPGDMLERLLDSTTAETLKVLERKLAKPN